MKTQIVRLEEKVNEGLQTVNDNVDRMVNRLVNHVHAERHTSKDLQGHFEASFELQGQQIARLDSVLSTIRVTVRRLDDSFRNNLRKQQLDKENYELNLKEYKVHIQTFFSDTVEMQKDDGAGWNDLMNDINARHAAIRCPVEQLIKLMEIDSSLKSELDPIIEKLKSGLDPAYGEFDTLNNRVSRHHTYNVVNNYVRFSFF